jgi:hypothetical protein
MLSIFNLIEVGKQKDMNIQLFDLDLLLIKIPDSPVLGIFLK